MNAHLLANRRAKAQRLADVLWAANARAEDLPFMSEFGWGNAAAAARVAVPSLETRDMVAKILTAREAEILGNPFEGF